MGYITTMVEIIQSDTFKRWLSGIKDRNARMRIHIRLDRMTQGNLGDIKPLGNGLSEARIDYGPGYRLYFVRRGTSLIVLLAGGDKRTQRKDIARALNIAEQWKGKP
jgi:putative addiction module killer protein